MNKKDSVHDHTSWLIGDSQPIRGAEQSQSFGSITLPNS